MKLHLPKPLRNSVLACIAAVAGIATPTLGTATFAGGVVAFSFAQQAMAESETLTSDTTWDSTVTKTYAEGDQLLIKDNANLIIDGATVEGSALMSLQNGADVQIINGANVSVGRFALHDMWNNSSTETLLIDGGTLNITGTDPGTGNFKTAALLGHWGNATSPVALILQSGTLNITNGTIQLGHSSRGLLDIRGGVANIKNLDLSSGSTVVTGGQLNIDGEIKGANGQFLLKGGKLTFGEGASFNVTITMYDGGILENNSSTALTMGVHAKFDLSNLTATTGADGSVVYTVLTGTGNKDVSALSSSNIELGTYKMGKTWTFGTEGTISYKVTTKDVVWSEGASLSWNATGSAFTTGGDFANGDNVTFSTSADVTIAEGGVEAVTLVIQGEGTHVKLTNAGPIYVAEKVVVKDGAKLELAATSGGVGVIRAESSGYGGEIVVEDGGVLHFSAKDVTGYNGGNNSTKVISVNAGGTLELGHVNNETFSGTLNLDGVLKGVSTGGAARWDLYGNNASINVSAGATAKMENAALCLRGENVKVNVGEGGSLTIEKEVSRIENNGVLVKEGSGSLVIQGEASNDGFTVNGGSVEITNASERTMTISGAAGTSFTKNGAGIINMGNVKEYSYAGEMIVKEGEIKFTSDADEQAVAQPGIVRLYNNLVTAEDTKAVVEGNVSINYTAQDAQSCTPSLNGNLEITGGMQLNSYGSGNAPDGDSMRRWNIESDGALTVGGALWLSNKQKMVVSGGDLVAAGGIILGHGENGAGGAYKAKVQLDSGSVTTSGIEFKGGHNSVVMNGGTLEFTSAEAFTGGADNNSNQINLLGGTIKVSASDVTLAGSAQHNLTMGGIDIDVASGKTATLGGTISLSSTIEKTGSGTLKLDNGVVLSVDNLGAFDRGEGATYTDFNGSTTSGNGFFSGSILLIAGDYNKAGALTVQVGGTAVTNYVEDSTGLGVSVTDNSTYFVNTGTVTLTESKDVSAFYIASGAVLAYEAGDFTDVVITGSGVYDIGSNYETANRTGVTNADAWTGTVRISNATVGGDKFSFNNYGNVNSALELVGVSGWLPQNSNMAALLLLGKDTEAGLNGINVTAASNWTHTFSGGVAGEGDFLVSRTGDGNPDYVFRGDMSGWTGAFRVDNESGNQEVIMKVENTGVVTTVNAGVECIRGNLTLEVAGSNGKAVFNKAVNATTLKINGHGEFTKDVTLSGDLKFTADTNNHVVFHGTNNIVNVIDLSNGNAAAGILELKKGAAVTSRTSLWMRPDASILLEEGASVIWDDTKVIGKAGSVAEIKASANAAQWMDTAGLQVKDALFEVSKNEARTVAALLQNSSIINSGTALVTVTNAGNTLTGVEAKAGNIVVQNATTGSVVGLGAIAAADGLSISAEMESAKVSAITLGAGATFSTTGALTVADGSALSLGAGAGISMNGSLTLGSGLAITVSDVTKDTTLFSGVTSIATSLDDITAYISSVNGLTDLSDYTLELDGTNLVLVVDKGKVVTWDAANSTWEDGAQFGATAEDADVFINGDMVVFGNLAADEAVTIEGEIHAVDMAVDASAGKTYTFTAAADGGTLTVPTLSITSGKAVFGANTIQLDSLAAVTVGQTGELDVSAYGLGAFSKLVTKITGDGTVKIGSTTEDAGNAGVKVDLTAIEGTTLNLNANYVVSGNMALDGGNTAETVAVMKGLTVGTLRVQNGTILELVGGELNGLIQLGLGRNQTGGAPASEAGHLVIHSGATVAAANIMKVTAQNAGACTITMDGGILKMTATNTITDIATTITGGTLVADTASWGITGATIGGATVTTSGDYTITLTDTTLTDKLTVSAGKLALTGSVDINPTSGFDAKVDGAPRYYAVGSEQPTDNGFRFLTKVYTLADGDGALDVTGVTSWKMDGTALGTEDYTYADKLLTVNNTADGTLYWVNSGTVNYGASGTEGSEGYVPGADMTGATGLALNGGTIQLNTSLQDGWTIERKATGFINLSGSNVVLKSSQVTGTGSATLTGNGVYDIGSTALGIDGETVVNAVKVSGLKDAANWTGTVVVKDSVGTSNKLGLNELGNANSTVKLVNTQGYLWNGTGSNTLASVDTNVILADSDNDYNAALTIANGSSKSERENEGYVMSTFTKKVSGTGNMAFSWTAGYTGLAFTGDVSEWTGAFIVTAGNDTGNGHVNLKFSGDANVIKADLKRSAADRQQLMVYLDDAGATDTTAGITMHGSIEATKLILGLAGDTADSRAKVNLNNSVTVDTLTNYAATTLGAAHTETDADGNTESVANNLTVGTLTNAGTLTVNGTLVDGAAVTNDGTLELTQDAATLASLAGTGTVTAKSLTLTGAATDSNGITADSLTLQAATNTVGALTLDTLTLGANVTSLTAGELNISGDVVVSKVAANFLTSTTGLATGSKLNLNIDEALLQDYMAATNTTSVQLATVTGLSLDLVTLNKDTTGWSATDYTLTTSDDQYTYALDVDANGTLTLTRATNGIIWNGEVTTDATTGVTTVEKWVMNDTTVGWKTKGENPDDLAYGTVAQSTIFNGDGAKEVVVSGAVTTTNVTFDVTGADIDGYTFTDDAETATADLLNIEKNLSINGGELKLEVNTQMGGRTEVGATGKLTLATPQNSIMAIGSGLSNRGELNVAEGAVVMVGDAITASESVAITNAGTMTNAGQLLVSGMLTNTQQLTNSGQLMVGMDATNTGILTNTAGQFGVTGNLTNGAAGEDATNAELVVSGGQLTIGGQLVNNATGKVSISGDETMVGVGNDDIDVAVDNAGNININGGTTTITGAVANTGSIAVTGGSLSTGDVDNDGTLSVAGGSMTVTGDLDNTDGTLTLGSDDATGSLKVTGSLTHAGNSNIEVNSGSSLDVTGDLAADGMELGFDGTVTVGGTATLKDLSIAEGATFTAENATITGVLDNDGSLTVTTTEVEDDNGNVTYTGGQLSIGTLTGAGVVHVEEGGTLSIGSSVNFTGTLTGEGKLTTGNQAFTLLTKQDEVEDVALATDISAKSLVVAGQWMNDAGEVVAEGTPGAKWASANGSILGEVATDGITFTKLDTTGNKHLTMESLQAYSTSTASGVTQVEVALSQLDTEEGVAELIKTGVHTYNLLSYVDGKVNFSLADMAYDREQQLWKSGLKLGELTSATTMALRAAGTNVSISVLKQSLADATWNTAGETTGIGLDLGTLTNGTMVLKGNDMLDKVQSVNVTKDVTLDLSSNDTNAVNVNGLTGGKTLNIAGNGDVVNVSTVADGFGGTLGLDNVQATVSGELDTVKLTNKTVADLAVTDTDVEALTSGLTLNGSMKGGKLSISKAAGVKGTLKIDGTDLNIAYDDKGALSMSTANVATTGQVLVNMDKTTGEAGDIFIGKDGVASKLMEKYYANVRFEDNKGVVADRNTVYYTSKLTDSASTDNGKAGLAMADESLLSYNPQNTNPTGDLAAVLDQLDAMVATGNKAAADELGASLAGASTAVLGMAAMGDVDRQLRAIRNRTTTMGVDQSVVNADMPYFNAWINAEGDSREMGEDETLGGYKLNSYGGTVGFDVDIEPTLTAGMALTAMYGDLDATGTDKATGNLDSYYVSAFARYCGSAWTHTFVGTIGMGDISLDRTVGSAQVKGETDSMSFGLMYEVGRVYAMDEDGTTCLQPVFNVTWKHTTVDAYTEKGGDVALSVDEQSLDTITFGLGARLQTVVGESMYNRTSIFECRLLAKADAGDTEGTSKVALGSSASHEVKSNEMGAIGIELGAGLTIPLGDEGSSIFMDASAEIRADYTDVNGTVGYRVNF